MSHAAPDAPPGTSPHAPERPPSMFAGRVMFSIGTLVFGVLMLVAGASRQVSADLGGRAVGCGRAGGLLLHAPRLQPGDVGTSGDWAASCQHQARMLLAGPLCITLLAAVWVARVLLRQRQASATTSLTAAR